MKVIKTIIGKVKCCFAAVVRSGADMATAKALMIIWTGLSYAFTYLVVYLILTPIMFVALVVALPYIVMRKLTGIDLIDW